MHMLGQICIDFKRISRDGRSPKRRFSGTAKCQKISQNSFRSYRSQGIQQGNRGRIGTNDNITSAIYPDHTYSAFIVWQEKKELRVDHISCIHDTHAWSAAFAAPLRARLSGEP